MRQITEIINQNACLPQKEQGVSDCEPWRTAEISTPNENCLDLSEAITLWTRMEEIYPHKWSSKLGQPEINNSAFQTWRNGLAGMIPEQIARGLEHCIRSGDAWPPSLPQFRSYCQFTLKELGLPSLEDAYRIARQQRPDWSQVHPIVYHARQMVGLDTIIKEPDRVVWPQFENAYQALVARVLAGEVFELPVSAFPQLEHHRVPKVTASGEVRAHLKVLRDRLKSTNA